MRGGMRWSESELYVDNYVVSFNEILYSGMDGFLYGFTDFAEGGDGPVG